MSVLCLRFVCCALLALPLIASICVALIKRKRNREVRPAVGFAQTSNTNQYGAVLTNGSANQSKECSGAPDATQTKNQNAENVQHGISKSKYTQRDIQILFLAFIANMYADLTHFNWLFFHPFLALFPPFPLFCSHILFSQLCYRVFRRSLCRTAVRGCSPQKALEAVIPLWMASVSSVSSGSSQATPCSSVPGVTWVRVRGRYPYPRTIWLSFVCVFHLISSVSPDLFPCR